MPGGSRSGTQTSSSSSDSSPARKPNKRGDEKYPDLLEVKGSPHKKRDGSSNGSNDYSNRSKSKSRDVPSFESSDSISTKGSNPEEVAAYCPCSCHTKSTREVRTLYHFDGSDNGNSGYTISAVNLIIFVWVTVVAWFVYCHVMNLDKLYDPIIELENRKS